MSEIEKRIVIYLYIHPDKKFVDICTDLELPIKECDTALRRLMKLGRVINRGYASHVDCYYLSSGAVEIVV